MHLVFLLFWADLAVWLWAVLKISAILLKYPTFESIKIPSKVLMVFSGFPKENKLSGQIL